MNRLQSDVSRYYGTKTIAVAAAIEAPKAARAGA